MSSTSSSNYRRNKAAIDQFRKELKSMFHDISEVDVKILNKSVNEGARVAKENTNVVSGFMRKNWRSTPAVKSASREVKKVLVNSADYSEFVNYGHRIVDGEGKTVGFVKGQFMLEKAISHAEKTMKKEFEKEIERINRKHDQ